MEVSLIAEESCHRGFLEVRRSLISHTLLRGGMSEPIRREYARSGPVVAVLPYDPVRDQVVLIRQFRIGAWAAGHYPAPWDIVAGISDDKEDIEAAARRELEEETGCAALRIQPIGKFLTAPHVSSERLCLVCAQISAFAGERHCGLPAEGEDILALPFACAEAFALLSTGELPLWAAMALQWLQFNRDALREAWSVETDHPVIA
ncbi:NUDIX domain-containing protein [Propionivibrio sp.]|uniref:NUDIX domain-containing protein n=1 Tax=Propionivibrio sp. TaxID=2212460 RepID=UPI003BF42C46